jgi:hypothetical protein
MQITARTRRSYGAARRRRSGRTGRRSTSGGGKRRTVRTARGGGKRRALVEHGIVHAKWCSACQEFIPSWRSAFPTLVPNVPAREIEESEMKEKGLAAITGAVDPPAVRAYPTIYKVTIRGGRKTMDFYDATAVRSPQAVKAWLGG